MACKNREKLSCFYHWDEKGVQNGVDRERETEIVRLDNEWKDKDKSGVFSGVCARLQLFL